MYELDERLSDSRRGIDLLGRHIDDLPERELMLAALLRLATDGLSQHFARVLHPHHLRESEFVTLMQLFIHDGSSIAPAELCRLVDQTRANMTHITRSLEQRGFITRATDDSDRRRVELRITPTGREFVRALLPPVFDLVRASLGGLSAAQQHTLQVLLQTIVASLGSPAQPALPHPIL